MSPRGDFWPSFHQRLVAKLVEDGDCIVSKHSVDSGGYPQIYGDGKQRRVHKVWWEMQHGQVPEGLEIDHTCERHGKRCVAHLELVPHAENIRRGLAAKRKKELV